MDRASRLGEALPDEVKKRDLVPEGERLAARYLRGECSLTAELGKYGITVNIVSPGPIQTGYIMPEVEKKIAREAPLRGVGKPKDVADVMVFLASEQARWLTGQLIYVGGGWRMHQ